MLRAASRCNKAITAPVWLVEGKSFSWGFTWNSVSLHFEEVSQTCYRSAAERNTSFTHSGCQQEKGEFPPSLLPCSSVANRATVQHKPLFWASFLPPSFLEQFPACFTFQLLCPLPCQWKLSACVAACTGKIQPP